jgi:hypothetical protein
VQRDSLLSALTDTPDQPRSLTGGVLLTVLAWFLDRVLVGITWGATRNPFTFHPNDWIRWDSFNYLNIAAHGTRFGRCGSPGFPVNFLHQTWCGTAGWLPGYPWVLHVLHAAGLSLGNAGLGVSWTALMTAMFLVWCGWCRELPQTRALSLLLLFGAFPGAVYNFAVFPTSLALCFVIAAILSAISERWILTTLFLVLAGLCYPTAWLAALGVAAAGALVGLALGPREAIRRALFGLAGLLSIAILFFTDTPHDAFFVMDTQRGQLQPGSPGAYFLRLLVQENTIEQKFVGKDAGAVLALQGAMAVIMAGVAGVLSLWHGRWRHPTPHSIYPAMVGGVVTLGVIAVNTRAGAWDRSIVLAAPCVVCLRHLPTWMLGGVCVVVLAATAILSHFFFNNTMV